MADCVLLFATSTYFLQFPEALDFPESPQWQSRTPRRLCTFRCRRSMIDDQLRPLYQTLGMRACPTTRPCSFASIGTLPLQVSTLEVKRVRQLITLSHIGPP